MHGSVCIILAHLVLLKKLINEDASEYNSYLLFAGNFSHRHFCCTYTSNRSSQGYTFLPQSEQTKYVCVQQQQQKKNYLYPANSYHDSILCR